MAAPRDSRSDLLSLAEDVVAGRRALDNVIDQIAVATPDDRRRRRAVAELQSLVLALTSARAPADATASTPHSAGGSAPQKLVEPRLVSARHPRLGSGYVFAAGATIVAAVVVVAIGVASLRPAPPVGGPTALPSGAPSVVPPLTSPSPTSTVAPIASPVPTAAVGLPEIHSSPVAGPGMAFWSLIAPDRLGIWFWNPWQIRMAERLTVDTWPGDAIGHTVLVSPNGAHVAVLEIDSTTNSPVQRVRILTMTGQVLWTAPRLPIVTAMAWSPDGTALAIGSLPAPWTVVQLNAAATPEVTTYNLDDQDGYALLGFSEDSNTLYGYGTGGEAEFWQKPVAVGRARGMLAHLDAMPGGGAALSHANSTAPVGQFNGGRVVALAGGAKGDLRWVTRAGGVESPVAASADSQLTWGADAPLVALAGNPSTGANPLAVRRLDLAGNELPGTVGLPNGSYGAILAGARRWFVLLLLIPATAQGDVQPVREVVMVDLASGLTAVGLPPDGAGDAGFTFAGWLGDGSRQ